MRSAGTTCSARSAKSETNRPARVLQAVIVAAGAIDGVDGVKHGAAPARVNKGQGAAGRPFIVHQLAVLVSQALHSFPRSGQCDDLGAREVTVLDLEDTEGPMRLAAFVGG